MEPRGVHKRMLGKYHAAVQDGFSRYGTFVAHHPLIPITIGLVLLGSLCLGILRAEKETDIENLWVEQNSEVVPEKKFYDKHFGGISRKEAATINLKSPGEDNGGDLPVLNHDLGSAMDALTAVLKPMYDDISWNVTDDGGRIVQLKQSDFCERPLVPKTLRRGADPNIHGNWYVWGYRRIVKCALSTVQLAFAFNASQYMLPEDWGIDSFPCYKITPMDCFQEANKFDYPEPLQQLERLVVLNATLNGTLNQVVYGYEQFTDHQCFKSLESSLKTDPGSIGVKVDLSAEQVAEILTGIKSVITIFASWGYNWRPSYKDMTNEQILDYINQAVDFSKNTSLDLNNPALEHCITEKRPCCLTWFGALVPIESSFGDVKRHQSGKIMSIGAMLWGANHWNHNHPLWIEYISDKLNKSYTEEQRERLVLGWEEAMIKILAPVQKNTIDTPFTEKGVYEQFQVQFNVWRSTQDLLNDANSVPLWQILLSALLVCSYAMAAFINLRDPIHSHTWLVLMGMAVVSFSIASGFGLTSAFGIKLSPLAGSVVPFLALGLGIDDVFVLVNTLRNYLKDKNVQALYTTRSVIPEHEMRLTVTLAGPSVVLTTFSVLASFFISSVSPMPLVRWFCWQMGITASVHTCGMLLLFIPIMSLDARRVKAGIIDPSFWLLCGMRRTKGAEDKVASEPNEKSKLSPLETATTSAISRAVAKYYAPLFKYNSFKISMTFLFAALLGSTIYLGFWKVERGLVLSEISPKGSYQHDFAVLTEQKFPQYDLYLVTQNIQDYSTVQESLLALYSTTPKNLSSFTPSESKILDYSWLGNLYAATHLTLNIPYPYSPENFSRLAQQWSTSPLGIFSLHDMYCQSSTTQEERSCFAEQPAKDWSIGATKTVIFADQLGSNTQNNIKMITQAREALKNINNKYFNGTRVAYLYGFPFLFNEQYLHSSHDLYMVVGFALVGVFLAVLIFQFSLTVSLVIAILLLMVDIEVYGMLYAIGAKLNALSLVNLGIVIGMASEFTYLSRSFLLVTGSKNYRVGKALEWTFEPLLHGLGTQIAATLPLIFLKYHAFRLYYFSMFTIMGVIGFLNGFVLLPIILTWIGPPPLHHDLEQESRQVRGVSEDVEKRAEIEEQKH